MTDVAVCVALGTYLDGKLPASGEAAGGVSAADFVPECADDARRWTFRLRHSKGVRGHARQLSQACQEVGGVVLRHGHKVVKMELPRDGASWPPPLPLTFFMTQLARIAGAPETEVFESLPSTVLWK